MDDKPPVLKLLPQVRHQELLLTKILTPRIYDGLIPRERVMSELDLTIKPGCTIVTAPAGSGKTLAVAGWIRSRQIPTAWLTLDSADNDTVRFRTYLLASLDRIVPGIEKRMNPFLTAGRDQQPASFGVCLINELIRHQEPVALVLDDIHVLSDEKLMNDLADIIRYFQDPVRLILVGRRVPGNLMNRLDGASLLHQVGAEALRFSQLEINTLMERYSIQLTGRQLHIIESRTEGWAMGLVLALRSIGAKTNYHTFIEALNEKGSSLGTYLSEEIFESWPLEVQDFLLKTSILHRMTPALCNAVTGRKDSRAMLKQLSKDRAFIICLNQRKGWYRYHNLLVSFLRHRLYRSRKKEVKTLYQKAAAYYERNGITREAIEFHLKGKHYPGASNLIEKMVPDMLRKQQEFFALHRWLNVLPENVILSSYILTVTNGWMKLLEGKFRETEEMIRKAKVNSVCTIQDEKQPANQSDSLPEITLLEANLYLVEKRFEEASSNMWKVLEEKQFRTIFPDLCRMVLCSGTATSLLAGPYGYHGRLSLLRSGGQWMYRSMAQQLNDPAGCFKILQAEVHYQRNELDLAVPLLMDGLNDAENTQAWEVYVPAVFLLVKIMTAQGNLAEALQTVEQTEEKIEKTNHQAANSFQALKAHLHLLTGSIDQAEIWLDNLHISLCDHPGDCSAYDQMTRVRVLIARKEYASASLALSRLEAYYESEKHQLHLVEIQMLQAVCSCHSGDQRTAMQQIHKALITGEQEDYRRLFMDEGPMLLPVLAAYHRWSRRETLDGTVDTDFTNELLKGAREFSKKLPLEILSHDHLTAENLPVEMLTPKETQVLKCLNREMCNQEIAEHMGIQLSTVKSHTRNIYSKLAVTSRTQAVAAARKHKML